MLMRGGRSRAREGMPRRNPEQLDRVRQLYRTQIIEGIARKLWVDAWMNWEIQREPTCPTCGSMDVADIGSRILACEACTREFRWPPLPRWDDGWDEITPLTPKAARAAAGDLATLIEMLSGPVHHPEDLLNLFEMAMWFDRGTVFAFEAEEKQRGGRTVLVLPEAKAQEAYDFGLALASESLGEGFTWAQTHTVERDRSLFQPGVPVFSIKYDGDADRLDWEELEPGRRERKGSLIDEATEQLPDGTSIHATLHEHGQGPIIAVRSSPWFLHLHKNKPPRGAPPRDEPWMQWYREGNHGVSQEAAAAMVPVPLRDAMVRLGVELWDSRVKET